MPNVSVTERETTREVSYASEHPYVAEVLWQGIAKQAFPGAVAAWGMGAGAGEPSDARLALGTMTFESSLPVTADSLWDVASLTKAMATVPAVMLLHEEGAISLDAPVAKYVPEFAANGKGALTVRQLLTHTAGLKECFTADPAAFPEAKVTKLSAEPAPALLCSDAGGDGGHSTPSEEQAGQSQPERAGDVGTDGDAATDASDTGPPVPDPEATRKRVLDSVMKAPPRYPPGHRSVYSDLSMIVIGIVIERCSGMSLERFCRERIFDPLGMLDTHFRKVKAGHGPPPAPSIRVVPTEVDTRRGRLLWGEVHDPTCYLMGGVAGHAGLFSTAADVGKFAKAMLASLAGQPGSLVRQDTARLFTRAAPRTRHNPRPFALGFDVATRAKDRAKGAAGRLLSARSFGHTGYTGTSLWIDPDRNMYVMLLSNAVHPRAWRHSGDEILRVRPKLCDAVVETVMDMRAKDRGTRGAHNSACSGSGDGHRGAGATASSPGAAQRAVKAAALLPLAPFRRRRRHSKAKDPHSTGGAAGRRSGAASIPSSRRWLRALARGGAVAAGVATAVLLRPAHDAKL